MSACSLDHLVVAASDLDSGSAWMEQRLGVPLSAGGEHALMGTHNRLLRLGPAQYLELIAINPDAPRPDRPRWFGLDDPVQAAALVVRPRLLTWVMRSDSREQLQGIQVPAQGRIIEMQRGELEWSITVPDDGQLPAFGTMPTLLCWRSSGHPAGNLPDRGCRLEQLEISHPRAGWLEQQLSTLSLPTEVSLVTADDPAPLLRAWIRTPGGRCKLDGLGSAEIIPRGNPSRT